MNVTAFQSFLNDPSLIIRFIFVIRRVIDDIAGQGRKYGDKEGNIESIEI